MLIQVQAFLSVGVTTFVMSLLVYLGTFDRVHTELGDNHYAESYAEHWQKYFPEGLKMPLNTLVNLGYIVVGAYYSAKVSVGLKRLWFQSEDGFMFYVFNFGAASYGVIQALRILTQKHELAVMDQWYTLPFFMWVFIWSRHVTSGIPIPQGLILITGSLLSYFLTLWSQIGFEITLACHILLAVIGGVSAYRKYPTPSAHGPFLAALFSCIGFVVLKLLDLELPRYHAVFNFISGHFLSKIADVLQIYFVNSYFETITMYKNKQKLEKRN